MKINASIFYFPPYISTTWDTISTLSTFDDTLVITLKNNQQIKIPALHFDLIELIFTSHAAFLEIAKKTSKEHSSLNDQETKSLDNFQEKTPHLSTENDKKSLSSFPFLTSITSHSDLSFKVGPHMLDGLGVMQHNPNQASSPDIPEEILKKITAIAKIVVPDEPHLLPQAEPHCNCLFCQISRAITQELTVECEIDHQEEFSEIKVPNEELQFCQWEISQINDNLYHVTNRMDDQEKYSVFLGDPLGCTCGISGCEHIVAVLKS